MNHARKMLKQITKEFRNETESRAERRIWKSLLSKRQSGERFLRQQPIDDFTVGFFCPELNLVVEIEGNSGFSAPGYHVVRFSENEIINQIDDVGKRLQHAIRGLRAKVGEEMPVMVS